MLSSPPGQPGTPQRAFSEDLSPLPRNPMADADSSVRRKRPRLDSGERAHRSMSADPSLPALSPGSELFRLPPPPPHSTSSDAPPPSDLTADPPSSSSAAAAAALLPLQPLSGTPSKVTINLRDASLAAAVSPSKSLALDGHSSSASQESQLPLHTTTTEQELSPSLPAATAATTATATSTAMAAVAASPSPMGSPQIEIAEPEDMDGHDGPTVWLRADNRFDIERFQELDFALFPFYKGGGAYQAAMEEMVTRLKQDESQTGPYLFDISAWIDQHLARTAHISRHWFELFTSAREFWESLPLLIETLSRRQATVCPDHCSPDEEGEERPDNPVQALLTSFAALAARIFNTDLQTLKDTVEDTAVSPDLIGARYLNVLSAFIGRAELPLLKSMRMHGWPLEPVIASAIEAFLSNLDGGHASLTEEVILQFGRTPLDTEGIVAVFDLVKQMAEHIYKVPIYRETEEAPLCFRDKTIQRGLWQFFSAVDAKLQDSISKQNSSINLENLKWIVTDLSSLLRLAAARFPDSADGLSPEFESSEEDPLSREERTILTEYSWKMRLLKKCMIQGRMETRMLGVDYMQDLLVEAWNRYIKTRIAEGAQNAIVTYLADFILSNRLIEYLVGVESHHQLIARSKNIIGFLVVAGKYSQKETDTIWTSIVTSQDPRTTESVTEMARGLLELSSHTILLSYCEKLKQLPLAAFDSRMRFFCNSLTGCMAKTRNESWPDEGDIGIYLLYIRLIREVFPDTTVSAGKKREILNFAISELRTLLRWKLSEPDQMAVFAQCFGYLADGSPLASGSVTTINILLENNHSPNLKTQLEELDARFRMTELLVADIARLASLEIETKVTVQDVAEILTDRLALVQKIVIDFPDALTPQLRERLWDSLVGEQALDDTSRDIAWSYLSKAIQIGKPMPNSFADAAIHEHFPRLSPEYFTQYILQFAAAATDYEMRRTASQLAEGGAEDDRSSGDLFWPIALKSTSAELGAKAIETLVNNQLLNKTTRPADKASTMESHAKFIDRGIQQLISAAEDLKQLYSGPSSGSEDDTMILVPSDKDVAAAKLRFARSLAILNKFMHAIRSDRALSPLTDTDEKDSPPILLEGEEVIIRYQPHVGGKSPGIFTLKISDLATFEQLIAQLTKRTGFSEFNLIAGGQKVDLAAHQDGLIRDLKFLRIGLLLIQKVPGSKADKGTGTISNLSPLEKEVMKHFAALYALLAIDDDLGRDVFAFLSTFLPHEEVMSMVSDGSKAAELVFPQDAPFKSMYSIYALKTVLVQRLSEGAPCLDLISHGVRILTAALLASRLANDSDGVCTLSHTGTTLFRAYVECLLKFLKEPVPKDTSDTYFDDTSALLARLKQLIECALQSEEDQQSAILLEMCFAATLEASVHDKNFRQQFKADSFPEDIVYTLLIKNPNISVRDATKASIKSVLTALKTLDQTEAREFSSFFWNLVVALIPRARGFHQNVEQFFTLALEVFRQLDDGTKDGLPLKTYLQDWSVLLYEYQHEEFVGRYYIDWVVFGLAGLLHWCMLSMKAGETDLQLGECTVEKIFENHLFPDIINSEVNPLAKPKAPVLDSATRGRLYSVVMGMANNKEEFRKLLNLVGGLLSEGGGSCSWSWGLAQVTEEYTTYDPNWNFDRLKSIRSHTGYAGIKNLSNTCYMNSLMTQLFMNTGFREFMLSANVSDPHGSQKLLFETQRLLAFLQGTWLRAVDPESVAASIVTYEGSPIDISIQMDVDEFYNLLFDRWESQILLDDDKEKFRQFYGGQIVQQIKSKDCPHVSERLEPFSAIQCDIQGKASLAESLNAYVEGEVMEGDNKYSCSSCGTYVNAVKRACLKDIPDNLIFHLKRFDYDVMGGTRNKINEYFEFPTEIDMASYNVAYLRDTTKAPVADKFALVGVLVHTGSAEAGHYYSYIRERPGSGVWLEFNDSEVSYFDPANLAGSCFGGWQEPYYGGMAFPKTWNAYMLFYQRSSSMQADTAEPGQGSVATPNECKLPGGLATTIFDQNEAWIRRFCIFDNEHAKFVKALLEKYRRVTKDVCTEDHALERTLLNIALQHVEQVLARQKDSAELFNILDSIGRIAERCPDCCKILLQWILKRPHCLKNLLLRCPMQMMRTRTRIMIFRALKYLREHDPVYYGIESDSSSNDSHEQGMEDNAALDGTVCMLADLLPIIHNFGKAWEDYYGLLADIAELGSFEQTILHEKGFLLNSLQVLVVLNYKWFAKGWPHMAALARLSERRSFSLTGVIFLLHILLRGADLSTAALASSEDESLDEDDFPTEHNKHYRLSADESRILVLGLPNQTEKQPRTILFLEEIFQVTTEDTSICDEVVRTLVRATYHMSAQRDIYNTIMNGIRVEPAASARPYLCGGLAFCETTVEHNLAKQVIMFYARDTSCIGSSGGAEYLDFFAKARLLWNEAWSSARPNFFKNAILTAVPLFAPHLLFYQAYQVRADTVKLLHTLVFDHDTSDMDDEQEADALERVGRKLGVACLEQLETIVRQRHHHGNHGSNGVRGVDAHRVEELQGVLRHCVDEYFIPSSAAVAAEAAAAAAAAGGIAGGPGEANGHGGVGGHDDEDDEVVVDLDLEYQRRAELVMDAIVTLATSSPEEALSAVEYDSEEGLTDYSNAPEAA